MHHQFLIFLYKYNSIITYWADKSTNYKDDQIGTNPAPGVIATRPITKPVEAPTKVVFLSFIISSNIHDNNADADAIADVINACAASPSAFKALPALNPNHPNQSIVAPNTTNGILCILYVALS